jgi:type IV secretion system protein VirB5
VSDQARIFPQFETINPLGLTITEFHENRMSVDPMPVGVNAAAPAVATSPATEGTR